MRRILMISALSLAACSQQEPDRAPASVNESASAPAASAAEQVVPALEGQWLVEAIDGKPVAAAMTASFANGKVGLASGCLRRAWTYTQKRNVVSFAADPAGSANCGGSSPSGEQETAYAALEQASIAIFNKDGSEANLSGTGGNLTLQRR